MNGAETAHRPALFESPIEGYIFLRLLLGLALLALATVFVLRSPPQMWAGWILAFRLSALTCLAMGVSAAFVRRYGRTTWFLWSQMALDTVFATALISLASNPDSTYFVIYFMSIVAAARLLPSLGVVVVAAVDVVAYGGIAMAGLMGVLNWDLSPDSLLLYSQVLVRIFGLILVGFLSVGLVSRKDLTAALDRVRLLEKEHSELLEQLPVAVLSSRDGIFDSQNAATQALLGAMIRQPIEAVFSHEEERWEQRLGDGEGARWMSCQRAPREGGGEIFIVEDITRLREMESVLERDERLAAVGRLAASLAHEIRNPLASLSGSVQLLQEHNANPLHRIILREVHRLDQLVEDFLTSARPLQLSQMMCKPTLIIEEVLATFANDPRCHGKNLTHHFDATPTLFLDFGRFQQVIWNLLINAAHATGDDGKIEIRVSILEESGDTQIAVSDNGVGIAAEKLLRIFDPFYTTRTGGTGLGLANVDRIVRAHGGTVSVESREEEGTTFFVRMPLHPKN
ncbi:MAG: ATP-binding protein [Myxococcota bacterium]|nr:ATP-binding protein [Myxococcota bacterium]